MGFTLCLSSDQIGEKYNIGLPDLYVKNGIIPNESEIKTYITSIKNFREWHTSLFSFDQTYMTEYEVYLRHNYVENIYEVYANIERAYFNKGYVFRGETTNAHTTDSADAKPEYILIDHQV